MPLRKLARWDAGDPMTAIFLHSGWRTGSTYVWNRFRQDPRTLAYYEPLHELLGHPGRGLTEFRSNPETSHHPALDAPYFAEYQPLIDDGRIGLFDPAFAYRRFFLSATDREPGLERYLRALIDPAEACGRVPVLGFSRSLGRVGWLKHTFDAVHLLVVRNPRSQWASILHQKNRHNISYFLINQFLICGQNRDHPLLRPLIARYDIPLVRTSSVINDIAVYQRLFDGVGDGIGYLVFYYLWRITVALARADCDIVIDVDRLATDSACRSRTAATLQARTGLALSFDDAAGGQRDVEAPDLDYRRIETFVAELLPETVPPLDLT
jgi:hypothetical protein